jgi:putative transcriptional regulator
MSESVSLAGRFLLAMPGMGDPRFRRSVNAMMIHDEQGALGIGLGNPCEGLGFHTVLEDLDIDPGHAPDCYVLDGGPVEPDHGFVLHSTDWHSDETIIAGNLCGLTASMEILRAIAEGKGPRRFVVALGYAGWSSGQLEGELQQHGWQVLDGEEAILYDTRPSLRWSTCWRRVGIDPALLAGETGRA